VTAEPRRSRWARRDRTIPLMLGVTVAGVLASPAILVTTTVVDLANRRFRLPTVRVALFLLQYGINDSIEFLLAPIYWTLAGFGSRLRQPASVARHDRLQQWSIDVLARRAERLLGLRLDIDSASAAALTPGPAIVLCRHVNIVDASLPTLLYRRLGYRTRGVIMAELRAAPASTSSTDEPDRCSSHATAAPKLSPWSANSVDTSRRRPPSSSSPTPLPSRPPRPSQGAAHRRESRTCDTTGLPQSRPASATRRCARTP
jgi:hypothetical protein